MKKTLIALAAVASTAAFAQSTVTISGLVDIGYGSVNAPGAANDINRVAQNGSATTAIIIAGSEDLGGGLKANFRYEMNPDYVGGTGLAGATGANGYNFVELAGGFGSVKFGRLNTHTLTTYGIANRYGTALGSGYGSEGVYTRYPATVAAGGGVAATGSQTTPTRFNGAIEYTTPNISGLVGRFLYVPKVDNVGGGTANRAGITDIGAMYTSGGLTVSFANQRHKFGANGVVAAQNPANFGDLADATNSLNTLAARYVMGAITVRGGYFTESTKLAGVKIRDIDGYTIGASYVMDALELSAQYTKSDDDLANFNVATAGQDRSVFTVGADYSLSKRTAAYVRYSTRDMAKELAGDFKTKTLHAGIRHTF